MIIKVCGLKHLENLEEVSKLSIDLVGLNFYKTSPRFAEFSPEDQMSIRALKAGKAGVFVNAAIKDIRQAVDNYKLDYIQLHGNESDETVKELSSLVKVIRVYGVSNKEDVLRASEENIADMVLFDKKSPLFGGTGEKFDWDWLEFYDGEKHFLLAGGLGPDDAKRVQKIENKKLAGVDLNSKFEDAPGLKNTGLIEQFLKSLISNNDQ